MISSLAFVLILFLVSAWRVPTPDLDAENFVQSLSKTEQEG